MIIRNCTEEDVDRVRKFVNECKPLELHTSFTYWTVFKYFSNLCFLMVEEEKIIGFISGIRSSSDKEVVYLWQIGIDKEYRGKNYASVLIGHLLESAKKIGCDKIQVSIAPENHASYNAFLKYANENSYMFVKTGEIKYHDKFTDKNEFEILYEIQI